MYSTSSTTSTSTSMSSSASSSASVSSSTSASGSNSSSIKSTVAVPEMVSSLIARPLTAGTRSRLQVAIHEVDLLQPPKALADVLRTDLSHALHVLELDIARSEQLVEAAKGMHDGGDDELRQAGNTTE